MAGSPVYYNSAYVAVLAETTPDKISAFYAPVDEIVRDLQTGLVTQDELDRASTPLIEQVSKLAVTNEYWAEVLKEVVAKHIWLKGI